MNIEYLHKTLIAINGKLKKFELDAGLYGNISSEPDLYPGFRTQFGLYFESLHISERETLKYYNLYQKFLAFYDFTKLSDAPNYLAAQDIINECRFLGKLLLSSHHLIRNYEETDSEFPLIYIRRSQKPESLTLAEFEQLVTQDISAFDLFSKKFYPEAGEVRLERIDSRKLSITIEVELKFLLLTSLIWNKIRRESSYKKERDSEIERLKNRGLSEETARLIKKETNESNSINILELIEELDGFVDTRKIDNFQDEITSFLKKLNDIKSKGFLLAFEPNTRAGSANYDEDKKIIARMPEVLEYDRLDDPKPPLSATANSEGITKKAQYR